MYVRILRRAVKQLEDKKADFVCIAITRATEEEISIFLRGDYRAAVRAAIAARDRLLRDIKTSLEGEYVLIDWLIAKGFIDASNGYDREKMQRTRIAWVEYMIEQWDTHAKYRSKGK